MDYVLIAVVFALVIFAPMIYIAVFSRSDRAVRRVVMILRALRRPRV